MPTRIAARRPASTDQADESAAMNAASMAPRAYGVDFLDNPRGQAPARSDESTIVQRVAAGSSAAPVVQRLVVQRLDDSHASRSGSHGVSLLNLWTRHLGVVDREVEEFRELAARIPYTPLARPEWDVQCDNLWSRGRQIDEISSEMGPFAEKGQVEDGSEPEDALATDVGDMFAKYRLEDVEQSTSEWSAPARVDVDAPPKQRSPEKDKLRGIKRTDRRLRKAIAKRNAISAGGPGSRKLDKLDEKVEKLQHKLAARQARMR